MFSDPRAASTDYAALAARLTEALGLDRRPIAVCLADRPPAAVAGPARPVAAGCVFWQDAASGAIATGPADHAHCAIGTFTHNLHTDPAHETDRRDALRVFADLGYVRPEDIPGIPVLAERPRTIVYAPLATTPLPPDVVLLFVRADQTLILAEASQSVDGGLAPAMGRPACAVVPHVRNTGRAALSLGCCGARAYLDALGPEVALYALPGARLAAYTDRIAELARANQVLTVFHRLRRRDVEAGRSPTVRESLAAMGGGPA
jgi:uncharacterized protein (DUF169 family)